MSSEGPTTRFSLATKISGLAIALIIVTAVGVCVFVIRSEMRAYYEDLLNRGITIADTASQSIEYGIYTEDAGSLKGVLQSLATDANIVYVAVLNRNGIQLAQTVFRSKMDIPALPAEWMTEGRQVQHHELPSGRGTERYLEIFYPVASGGGVALDPLLQSAPAKAGGVIGYLRLGLSQEGLRTKIRDLIIDTAVFATMLVAVASLLSVYLSRMITQPLLQLKTATRAISEGNFDYALDVTRKDEVSDLARAFNFMRESLKSYRDQLTHDALHDALTELPNRALFTDRLSHAMDLAKRRKGYTYGVLQLDLDNFKNINDSLGHAVGDRLLVELSKLLKGCIRPFDTVARLGGDEFAILLEDISGEGNSVFVAERILAALEKPIRIGEREVFATCSVGIALSSGDYEAPEDVMRDADTAMYQAKRQGRAKYSIFEPGMHAHAVKRLDVEMRLRRAVDRREFVTYYQPIVSMADRKIAGYEALVRWQHPERGLVGPGEFIQIAEETGLIVSIDRQVLRQACEQMKQCHDVYGPDHECFVSVNLSHRQLLQVDLVDHVAQVIRETGVDPNSLKLEITENVIFESPDEAVELLTRLRSLGVQLYIDDFGTGYSSLSYLHRLPLNGLKIDRSFIKRIGEEGEDHAIVRTILSLARDLNIEAIAEGIETELQRSYIEGLHCRYWQGFLFSKPLPAAEAQALMAN